MITIKEALGDNFEEIELVDDNSVEHGGISHEGETLGEFMSGSLDENNSIGELQYMLKACGIEQLEKADRYIQEKVQQKLWDIEEEFGIRIEPYSWDYKEFVGVD